MKARSAEINFRRVDPSRTATTIRAGLNAGVAVVVLERVLDPKLRARIKAEAKTQADDWSIKAATEDSR